MKYGFVFYPNLQGDLHAIKIVHISLDKMIIMVVGMVK